MSRGALFERHALNPILTVAHVPYAANAVFNPASAVVDGETVILARVEQPARHLAVARSTNRVDRWTVDRGGLRTVDRLGVIKRAEDKDAALPPERIDDKWIVSHRPSEGTVAGSGGEIVISRLDDLVSWSAPAQILAPRAGAWRDSRRIGIAPCSPHRARLADRLPHVKDTVSGALYRVGLARSDLEEPTRVTHRLPGWIFGPDADYLERAGDVPNGVSPCGLTHDKPTRETEHVLRRAATVVLATSQLDDVLATVLAAPA